MANKQVDPNAHTTTLVLTGSGNTYLYQAYIGRIEGTANQIVDVFIDDHCIQTGTQSTTVGDIARTWYDGISYSIVGSVVPVELESFTANQNGSSVKLEWSTATELNNLGFEIEKQTINASTTTDWQLIGFKEGQGTTINIARYSFIDNDIDLSSSSIRYRLKQIDFNGTFKHSEIAEVSNILPLYSSLEQNYPNPFNPVTNIKFDIAKDAFVTLKVYNVVGEEVTTLVNEEIAAGAYTITWNAVASPSGVYYYKITTNNRSIVKKMVLLK